MLAVEVALILIGVVFLLGSFFVTERLSQSEISKVAELSEDELRIVMERELKVAESKISDMVDKSVDLSLNQIERSLEKDTNEKIMAIDEYSGGVMEKLKKINNEVTFLYSMLGDKHNELNDAVDHLNHLLLDCQELREQALQSQAEAQIAQRHYEVMKRNEVKRSVPTRHEAASAAEASQQKVVKEAVQEPASAVPPSQITEELIETEISTDQKREMILSRYYAGDALKDIARDMGMGFGEVKLIVELYKGDMK